MKNRIISFVRSAAPILALLVVGWLPCPASAQILHEVFLANTEHELHVYRVLGEEPGKTMMLIGGIQGDEPGGYLTADLYADITLKKGNLIVVPRANLYSILLNSRNGLTGDMNRKFGSDETASANMEQEVVAILKHLIAESDCLLNLHEGSGFYSPIWLNEQENPMRFGQSIIYDTESYEVPGGGKIQLGELATKVAERVNRLIPEERYHFRPNNHDSLSPKSPHKEQRKSATFYALTQQHIPAFGVETSKSIRDLETKIRLHKVVINSFMEELSIILDAPGVHVEKPRLQYLLIKVNGGAPFALPDRQKLTINPGDEIAITDIIANYERGLVADVLGVGTRNDAHLGFRVSEPTRVVVRKDAEECGWVDIDFGSEKEKPKKELQRKAEASRPEPLRAQAIVVNVGDEQKTIKEGQAITVARGARIILQGVRTNDARLDNEVALNFKGYTPPRAVNSGNDLNYPIYMGKDLLKRYSEKGKGRRYPVEATYQEELIGTFWIEIAS
ncbi:MAG: hypothetical protein C4530_21650 [Desulfobacteraceae bacterium]|nr:MAG: hypothetical protein C4530_21650 [Desulfobacteraceae bacterium]